MLGDERREEKKARKATRRARRQAELIAAAVAAARAAVATDVAPAPTPPAAAPRHAPPTAPPSPATHSPAVPPPSPTAAAHPPSPPPIAPAALPAPALLSSAGCQWLGTYLALASLGTLIGLLRCWPDTTATSAPPAAPEALHLDTALLLLALCAGGLGACLHGLQSYTVLLGERRLGSSWVPWYLTRPLIGMSLGLLAYSGLRLVLMAASAAAVNPAAVAATAGLTGLFSQGALVKLAELGDTLFAARHPDHEAPRPADSGPASAGSGAPTRRWPPRDHAA